MSRRVLRSVLAIAVCVACASPAAAVAIQPAPDSSAYHLEPGYRLELVAGGLTYPTSCDFDAQGRLHVLEAGFAYGPARAKARVLRMEPDKTLVEVAGGFKGPLTGIAFIQDSMYVADGGRPGRILRIGPDGKKTAIVDGLPTGGDHYTSQLAAGPDGRIYFGVGSVTNSGVVGVDSFVNGWLGEDQSLHDLPTRDIALVGDDFLSADPLSKIPAKATMTGAFVPFRSTTRRGQVIKAAPVGVAAVYSVKPDGSGLALFADGLRNPFGLAFSADSKLFCAVQGLDDRGSRPVDNDSDAMWEITKGGWYGWPDFASGTPVTDPRFRPAGKPQPKFVLAQHPPLAERLVARFDVHSATMQFDFSRNEAFGFAGEVFCAQFGPLTPMTGTRTGSPGRRIVRIDTRTGAVHEFLVNLKPGPDSAAPERPVCVQFDPSGRDLYIVDFGMMDAVAGAMVPVAGSGAVWRVTKATAAQPTAQPPAATIPGGPRAGAPSGVGRGTALTALAGGAALTGWWLWWRLYRRLK